ncbi:hypothetical protein Ahy_A09g046069 isoform A [Arachis hypogaea]|uniref:PB1 domain-containing protein n=1 Tax=Arachis hypogaea TaxID=3818 RepID=A0A445BNT7_ARAHY|nr:uncharacterized protein LOC112710174 isoform X2 [Arachis hypogaea]RYR40337.1 hypothetical protein Ahy_A09g046069 isoform A [Arachis hypogaea]
MDTTPARFKCSYGGEIRHHDDEHHRYPYYAGGIHRMLQVQGDINFAVMTAELSLLCGGAAVTSFKYLIPGDDLDTLVTVSDDRDFCYLMREYDLHYRGSGSLDPMRIFLDIVEQGGGAVAPQAPAPLSASDEDRCVNMELEGQLETQWGRVGGRVSFSFPGPLTPASALILFALILLLSLPIAFVLQNYLVTNAVAEFRDFEHHRDGIIHFEKHMNQLPGALEVPAKDTIEMVLHDKKGSRIHASLPKALVKKFCPVANIIQNGNIDDKELIDIFVEVVGNKGRQIVFTFEDLDKNRVTCILFGTLVDHILPHLDSIGPGPLIVAKSFLDKVHVQSSYYASKLHVNVYIKEVVDSKNRLGSTCQITSQYISHLSSQPSYSVSDEINGALVRLKSIEELLNCANEGSYWILASIVCLDVGKDDWLYKECTRCPQKLEGAEPFYCKRCDQVDSNPLLRFRLQVIVSDGTGSITLVLWDREAMQVVGKTATEIKENSFDDGDADTYPKALDSVIDTKLLIKVAVSSRNINGYDDVYNVMRISGDEELITKLGHDAAVASQELEMQGVDNNVNCQ